MMFPDIIGGKRDLHPALMGNKSRPLGENRTVRYRKQLHPRWPISLAWNLLSQTEADQIDAHVLATAAALTPFGWFDWRPLHWSWVLVAATGTGSAGSYYALPFMYQSDQSTLEYFSGAGTALTIADYSSGGGPDGNQPLAQFTTAVAAGLPIWMNGTFRRRFDVTFERDDQPLTRELETGYYSFASRLMTVK